MLNAENLKMKVKTKAHDNKLEPQDIMQMYFFERLLYRISVSKYKYNFILKGGLLLSMLFGNERRTTQDMDTMIKGIDLDSVVIRKILSEIINIKCDDNVLFDIRNIKDIRLNDKYGGLRVKLVAFKEHLQVPLSIDITVGDPITPRELNFKYKCMFEDATINILTFNIETIIAEKFETLITDNIMNTRTKDFYDLYILLTKFINSVDKSTLLNAIKNTFRRRKTTFNLDKICNTFELIKVNEQLKRNFINFTNKKIYAKNIRYEEVMKAIEKVISCLKENDNIK